MIPDLKANLETVLIAFGMWRAGEKCLTPRKPIEPDDDFGDVWCPSCREAFGCGDHDIPLPELTPELAWRVLIAVQRQKYESAPKHRAAVALSRWLTSIGAQGDDAEALITAIAAALEPAKGGK